MEKYIDIPGYEGLYQVSENGNFISLRFCKIRKITPKEDRHGYLHIGLYKDGVRKNLFAHRLVMSSFIGTSDLDVNHRNGIKTDNRLENLEYVTKSENIQHRFKELGHISPKSKKVAQISNNGEIIATFISANKAQNILGVRHISDVCLGKRKTAGGYFWKYV